jgi:hypothetical protein
VGTASGRAEERGAGAGGRRKEEYPRRQHRRGSRCLATDVEEPLVGAARANIDAEAPAAAGAGGDVGSALGVAVDTLVGPRADEAETDPGASGADLGSWGAAGAVGWDEFIAVEGHCGWFYRQSGGGMWRRGGRISADST